MKVSRARDTKGERGKGRGRVWKIRPPSCDLVWKPKGVSATSGDEEKNFFFQNFFDLGDRK